MTSLGHSDGHASDKKAKSNNGEKLDRENAFTKIIRHIKTLCNMICCCPCGVELPAAPSLRSFKPVKEPLPAGESKATTTPVTVSFPEIYSRCMMVHGQGYPVYNPEPDPSLSPNNRKTGIRIGDVGLVTRDGSFDFLFNVCGQYQHFNPPRLPDNFKTIESIDVAMVTHSPRGKHLFSGVEKTTHTSGLSSDTQLTSYRCSGPAGAVLELPEGATLFEAQNGKAFKDLAARHAESWYKYTVVTRERSASNGSLCLVTGSVKSDVWGVAVFDRPSNSEDYLRFIVDEAPTHNSPQSRYKWEQSGSVISNVGPSKPNSNKEEPDQCIFLRGLRIMLRQDRWDALTQSPSQPSPPELHLPPTASGSGEGNVIKNSATQDRPSRVGTITRKFEYDSTTMGEGWVSSTSQLYPSDVINMVLLKSDPDAKVALCHDTEWCKALPKVFIEGHTSLKMEELLDNIGQSYEIKIENGVFDSFM
ncbi:hypothetical protein M378DRAFT_13388 [Amanita muscaria Koide BX008]|uniref:Uncharacterized protein n=1 Tax=Amanita muscaria (strain Koide BX008) TaxID=946122 RepID=A0A0C2WXM0_AMAMK|nr:hypothetical protein M378DRAFT_13388 [Amanita muscaria Koide BX008]